MKGSEQQGVNLFLLGAILAVLYWPLEAAIHVFFFQQGTLNEQLFHPDANEFWMRIVISVLIIAFGAVGEMMVRRQREAKNHMSRLNRLLRFLSHMNQHVQREASPQAIFKDACRAAVEIGKFRLALVEIEQGGSLELAAWHTRSDALAPELRKLHGQDICVSCSAARDAVEEGRQLLCMLAEKTDCEAPWRAAFLEEGCSSAFICPIFEDDKVVGIFEVYAGDGGKFTEDETAILNEAADDISVALTNLKHKNQLQKRLDDLEHFQKATSQREFRIKELRDEVKQLQAKIEKDKRSKL